MAIQTSDSGFSFNVEQSQLRLLNNQLSNVTDRYALLKLRNSECLDLIRRIQSVFRVDFPRNRTLADWLVWHLESDITDVQMMLIEDTISYLKTGYRRIPITTYEKLFEDASPVRNTSISYRVDRYSEASIQRRRRVQHLIQVIRDLEAEIPLFYRWVRTQDTLFDLIYFLKLVTREKDTMLKL